MFLYRYVDGYVRYGYGDPIHEEKYKVIKETPKGYWIKKWIGIYFGELDLLSTKKKWISKHTCNHKKFAFENRVDAMRQYRFRKAAQVRILQAKMEHAEMLYQNAVEKDPTYVKENDEKSHSRWIVMRNKEIRKRRKINNGFLKIEDVEII